MTREELERIYEEDARRYYLSIPIEDTIDPAAQGETRSITLSSFDWISVYRPDFECFNELLIRYLDPEREGRVVPNNFVVVHPEPIKVHDVFDVLEQPVGPTLVIDYINDYRNPLSYNWHYDCYEQQLKVPYYLCAYPIEKRLTLYRLVDGKYREVAPNEAGRHPIADLEVEVGWHEGWMRFWFRGKMVPTPGEMYTEMKVAESKKKAMDAETRAIEAEIARLREELAKTKPG